VYLTLAEVAMWFWLGGATCTAFYQFSHSGAMLLPKIVACLLWPVYGVGMFIRGGQ
jgi:hypothetical protein